MKALVIGCVAGLVLGGTAARAQELTLSVTHSNAAFDLRAVDPAGTAYAQNLSAGSSTIWASTDDARTWSLRGRHPAGASFKVLTALSDGVLLANVRSSSGDRLSRSTDGGVTWRDVLSLGAYRMLTPHSIEESPDGVFFLEYQAFTTASVPIRLWVSGDRGATWQVRFTFQGHRHGHGLRAAPDGALWTFFGDSYAQSAIRRSADGGRTWTTMLAGEEARIVDGLFDGDDLVFGQDIVFLPPRPKVVRVGATGAFTVHGALPSPSYSIHRLPGGPILMGITREPNSDAALDEQAHLYGSVDGVSWSRVASYPRRSTTDYTRADVYWTLRSGETVVNLNNVTALSGGRGYQLVRATISGTPENPPDPEPTPTPEPVDPGAPAALSDDFDACSSTAGLGGAWTTTGTWYCRSGRARGESAAGLALATTSPLADTDVTGRVQLNWSTGSGLVARATGDGYYAARILTAGRIELIRTDAGQVRVLASAPADIVLNASRRLRLRVSGGASANLEVDLDGVTVLRATDASPLGAGRAGFLSGSDGRTQYDDFVLTGAAAADGGAPPGEAPPVEEPPPEEPPVPGDPAVGLPFADDFDACTSGSDLGASWAAAGRWYCRVGRARGEAAETLATVRGVTGADVIVDALVQMNGGTGSGVVARVSGGSYYAFRLVLDGRVELVRRDAGGLTILGAVPRPVATNVSQRLSLRVSGENPVRLEGWISGAPVLSATDGSANRLGSGGAGLLSGSSTRTQFDDFGVRAP